MIHGNTKYLITCSAAAWVTAILLTVPARAQTAAETSVKATIEKTTGMWVEGPGFDIKYGGTYDQCAARCITETTCVMIEYYRPEKKCNMYNSVRPLKTGGDSIVGTKKSPKLAKP
jgi:PAN domain